MVSFFPSLQNLKQKSILPGFKITLGLTLFYLTLIILIPLSSLFFKASSLSWGDWQGLLMDSRLQHAFKITFGLSFLAAVINLFFGFIVAWILVRYDFWGKKFLDSLIDLPFALPTAVAGIALSALYAPNGWIGQYFMQFNIRIAFTPLGILIALVFIGLPFVVRSIQPVLEDLALELEEAASCLGANRLQTFWYVLLPQMMPAILTGFAMCFARAIGEYGSVIFIAGNIPEVSEIVPLLIVMKLEQYNYAGATAIAILMLLASFVMLGVLQFLQKYHQKT